MSKFFDSTSHQRRGGGAMSPSSSSSSSSSCSCRRSCNGRSCTVLGLLICSNLLVFQLTSLYWWSDGIFGAGGGAGILTGSHLDGSSGILSVLPSSISSSGGAGGAGSGTNSHWHLSHPMSIPDAPAVALPSIRVDDPTANQASSQGNEAYYGGAGDRPHLGGFANAGIDFAGVSPATWKVMVEEHGIRSLLDVGCGRGISTSWFVDHGVDARCVEGSHDAVTQNFVAKTRPDLVTEHDFSRGPWWPAETVDAVWSVEVLEHVSRNFHRNLFPAFRKAAIIYCTHSVWGGHHHVEVHNTDWWIAKFQSFGFVYNDGMTQRIKQVAGAHKWDPTPNGLAAGQLEATPNHDHERYQAQHLWTHLMVFINPAVASLPQHNHILSEPGCYFGKDNTQPDGIGHRKCGDPNLPGLPENLKKTAKAEMALPDHYLPLPLTPQQDEAWERRIFGKTSAEAIEEWHKKKGAAGGAATVEAGATTAAAAATATTT